VIERADVQATNDLSGVDASKILVIDTRIYLPKSVSNRLTRTVTQVNQKILQEPLGLDAVGEEEHCK